ncbi:MAG TPA: ABC transporter ATP-binding protein, partial [Firmicutes bacterium]|nr:ABC transporter ATP-binding protein [Bacillota bacterium]
TKTRDGIVGLFQELNQQEGQTFIMVTHDPSLSRFADQVITMRDGVVVNQ